MRDVFCVNERQQGALEHSWPSETSYEWDDKVPDYSDN